MKKLLILFIFMIPFLLGQQVIYDNTVTIAWDAVAPIEGSTITYEVAYAPLNDIGNVTIIAETALLEYDVTVMTSVDTVVGVRTIQTIDSNGQIFFSSWNWSHENGLATPNPFILRPAYQGPDAPANLRRIN